MKRFTRDDAQRLCNNYGVTLKRGLLGFYKNKPNEGCARGLLLLDRFQGNRDKVWDFVQSIRNKHVDEYRPAMAEVLGFDEDYLFGVEAGFEGWKPYMSVANENMKLGYTDGEAIASLVEN